VEQTRVKCEVCMVRVVWGENVGKKREEGVSKRVE